MCITQTKIQSFVGVFLAQASLEKQLHQLLVCLVVKWTTVMLLQNIISTKHALYRCVFVTLRKAPFVCDPCQILHRKVPSFFKHFIDKRKAAWLSAYKSRGNVSQVFHARDLHISKTWPSGKKPYHNSLMVQRAHSRGVRSHVTDEQCEQVREREKERGEGRGEMSP